MKRIRDEFLSRILAGCVLAACWAATAMSQTEPFDFAPPPDSERTQAVADRFHVVLIGLGGDSGVSPLVRTTADRNLAEVERTLSTLSQTQAVAMRIDSLLGEEATRDAIIRTLRAIHQDDADEPTFHLLFVVGAVHPGPTPDDLHLATAESLNEDAQHRGISFAELNDLLLPLGTATPCLAVFDLLLGPDTGPADRVAAALASEGKAAGVPTFVFASRQIGWLEPPTAAHSHLTRALVAAMQSPRPDEAPFGDTDGRITVAEIGRFLEGRVESAWIGEPPASTTAAFATALIKDNFRSLFLRPSRLDAIEDVIGRLSAFVTEEKLDSRLMVEARLILRGDHVITSVSEERRSDLIRLVERLAANTISPEDYAFQRSVLLGEPPPAGLFGDDKRLSAWLQMSPFVRGMILVVVGGVLIYLLSRAILIHQSQEPEVSMPSVMADDFLTINQPGGKGPAAPGGARQDPSKRGRGLQPSASSPAIRPIRPVGSPMVPRGSGAPSPPKGVAKGAAGDPRRQQTPLPVASGGGPTEEEDFDFDHVDRPPSIEDLKARSARKTTQPPVASAAPPNAHGAELDDFDLDLDAAMPGTDSISDLATPTPMQPLEPATPSIPAKAPGATPPSALLPPTRRPSDTNFPALSSGVLPAIIRAWDLEWTGPMARSRYRILLGHHLEMGRPARAKEGEDTDLMISLLPVGEDRKPNPTLIAMLSRQAFAVDCEPEGARITVLNKASAHLSPDPHRPYWDWDNPMPGTQRMIAPGETLWASPHFGKTLAPISLHSLATAGETPAPCATQLHFDAVFHDLVGITLLLIPEGFELLWGPEPPAQVMPNVGEGPIQWLRAVITPQGLAIAPFDSFRWVRRQGRMLDEQTLLLGGVSQIEWKSKHAEMMLKLTPHALPRVGVLATKPNLGGERA